MQAGGNGEIRRGEKADWSPVPLTLMQVTHLRFQGTDLTSDGLSLLEVSGTAGNRGTFLLGTQLFEILRGRH